MGMSLPVPQLCKLLSDETRLRILVLLGQEELAVQELVAVTGIGQSRISHHLGLLKGAGFVEDRREGTWTFYRMGSLGNGTGLPPELWKQILGLFRQSEQAELDGTALQAVLADRQARNLQAHDRLAGVWRLVGTDLERGSLRAEALAAAATPGLVLADLGCGTGFFSHYLGERVSKVIAVDHSDAMLREARTNDPGGEIEYRQGELDALPIADAEVDGVLANLVLHHIADFGPVIQEMYRVVRPGGVVVISDLRPHGEEWMREEMEDLRLGIDPTELQEAFRIGGFEGIEEISVEDRYRMRSRRGRTARLDLFMIRGYRAAS
ncbi:MAG: metalloregulator ArsR/SmtB family transcription factor [Planctomycetota bacterium]